VVSRIKIIPPRGNGGWDRKSKIPEEVCEEVYPTPYHVLTFSTGWDRLWTKLLQDVWKGCGACFKLL